MLTVQELELAVSKLSGDELVRFREWFDEFEAKAWDEQFERDAQAGKLDKAANRAVNDFRAGKYNEL